MNKSEIKERWENYRKANSDKPLVRDRELGEVFNLINPRAGDNILEVGTGNGYLTFPIAKQVGQRGHITTADVSTDNLKSVEGNIKDLPIDTLLFNDEDLLSELSDSTFDSVGTIATLHHFDNRSKNTGENGRRRALQDFHRVLKDGGKLVIADVASDTISQRYFDAIDNPQHCYPEGHPYDFFTTERLKEILEEIGFSNISIEIRGVPWEFKSIDEAKQFIHTIHNAKCSEEDSFSVAKEYLGFYESEEGYELGWELMFVTATK